MQRRATERKVKHHSKVPFILQEQHRQIIQAFKKSHQLTHLHHDPPWGSLVFGLVLGAGGLSHRASHLPSGDGHHHEMIVKRQGAEHSQR